MHPHLIDTTSALVTFLNDLGQCSGQPPSLYIDLEGNNLSRHGTLSLMTILVEDQQKLYLIDVTTLGARAFDTDGSDDRSLRTVLESKDIIKVFFDIRNDSDALFSLYGIRVDGIEDLQLMELASRNFSKRCVNGLAKCVEGDSTIGYTEKRNWRNVKNNGRKLFDPAQGGSYAVFDQRPLTQEVLDYCAQDVTLMPHLREIYCKKLCDAWWIKIASETKRRIDQSQQPGYNGKGRHMALGPTAWSGWCPSSTESGIRTLFWVARSRPQAAIVKSSASVKVDTTPSEHPEALASVDRLTAALQQSTLAAEKSPTDSTV